MTVTALLLLGIGIAWTMVAISQSMLAGRKGAISAFYALGTLFAAPLAWLVCFRPGERAVTAPRAGDLALVLCAACVFNCAGQACLVAGMQLGHRAATLSIAQSAMALSFCSSMVFWHERPSVAGLTGLLAVLAGIIAMGRTRHESGGRIDRKWLLLSISSFMLIAAGQIITIWPSYWSGWNDTARLRTPLTLTISCAIYLGAMLVLRERPSRSHLLPAALWAGSAVVAFFMLFLVLDRLAASGCAGCVFPVAIGLSILGFVGYSRSRLHEAFPWPVRVGLCSILTGIALIALHVFLRSR